MNPSSLKRAIFAGVCSLLAACSSDPSGSGQEAVPGAVHNAVAQPLIERYVERWREFYPSAAFGEGDKAAAQRFEDFSEQSVASWLELNEATLRELAALDDGRALADQVDGRVLRRQVRLELEKWLEDRVLEQQPQWYASQISEALTYVLISERLTDAERRSAVGARLNGVIQLCRQGIARLSNGNVQRIEAALANLARTRAFYTNELSILLGADAEAVGGDELASRIESAVACMVDFDSHIRQNVLPSATLAESFGSEAYTRKLAIFSDDQLQPGPLADMALLEINEVRELMIDVSRDWWRANREGEPPGDAREVLAAALDAMEEDRADDREEFRTTFSDATAAAIAFVEQHELATMPANLQVRVELLPEHSPFARIGAVFPPGPFNPATATLLYLPSIPDSADATDREGFYRSFNDHFNLMIISHEIFPGHDMQFKVALEHAPLIRSLFSNQYYSEGWASLSEIVMLNAGWSDGNQLTYLAHLRKRLENAVRAYTSVMVHAEGWDEEAVIDFATNRGLLPPQFAANLWKRALGLYHSVQLTSYFAGAHEIRRLWDDLKQREGDRFQQRDFVDRVLRTGPVSMRDLRLLLLEK